MGKLIDLTGKKFNRLTVIEKTKERKHGYVVWKCKCDCGNIVYYTTQTLNNKDTQSCGCYHSQRSQEVAKKSFKKYFSENLIEGTNLQKIGQGKNKNNTSGVKGVYYNNTFKKWYAKLIFKGKTYTKGFKDINDAINCRKKLEEKYHAPILKKYKKKRLYRLSLEPFLILINIFLLLKAQKGLNLPLTSKFKP